MDFTDELIARTKTKEQIEAEIAQRKYREFQTIANKYVAEFKRGCLAAADNGRRDYMYELDSCDHEQDTVFFYDYNEAKAIADAIKAKLTEEGLHTVYYQIRTLKISRREKKFTVIISAEW